MNEQEKTCNNCKFNKGWHDPDPCMSCAFLANDRNNWEPEEEAKE